jgi:hypothetical protein
MSRNVVISFFPIAFELHGALFGRVLPEHTFARGVRHGEPLPVVHVAQIAEGLLGRRGHEHLAPDRENAVKPFPPVADYRRSAGARFEQADARRITRLFHGDPRDVQCEALFGVKRGVFAGREVDFAIHIPGPLDGFGIHRADHREAAFRPPARRLEHERFEDGLAIVTVGSEVAEVPPAGPRRGTIQFGVDGAIEHACDGGSVPALDEAQRRAAGK